MTSTKDEPDLIQTPADLHACSFDEYVQDDGSTLHQGEEYGVDPDLIAMGDKLSGAERDYWQSLTHSMASARANVVDDATPVLSQDTCHDKSAAPTHIDSDSSTEAVESGDEGGYNFENANDTPSDSSGEAGVDHHATDTY